MPRSKAKGKSLTPKKSLPIKPETLDPNNITIDLTNDSVVMDNNPEMIDLSDPDDDEVQVIGVQVGKGKTTNLKSLKSKCSIVVIQEKPLEDTSFAHKQTRLPDPFQYGWNDIKSEVENLEKTAKLAGTGNFSPSEREKINNAHYSQAAGKNEVDSGVKRFPVRQKRKSLKAQKLITLQKPKKGSVNTNKNSLKFIDNRNRQTFKKSKKVKQRFDSRTNNPTYGQNSRHCNPFTGTTQHFSLPYSTQSINVLKSLGGPENSQRNQTAFCSSTKSDRSECEIIGGTAETPPKWTEFGLNAYVSPTGEKDERLPGKPRPIYIDGSNVAIAHGKHSFFSSAGIKLCIDYFIARGHTKVKAFVPQFRRKSTESKDPHILEKLEKDGLIVFTPSREVGGQRIASYDDRYIVQCAAIAGAIIVSNDNYRDLYNEEVSWRDTIKKRILPFTWIDEDWIMFPTDPLGKHGPLLDTFLLF